MSTEALNVGAANAEDVAAQSPPATGAESTGDVAKPSSTAFLHSPPYSNNATKSDASDSELSDLDDEAFLADAPSLSCPEPAQAEPKPTDDQPAPEPEEQQEPEEDIGEVVPAEWSGKVPIFRPTMHQFKDFTRFMKKVDSYGMKSGIIKVIPPQEWRDKQPPLDELVKQVRVREPIKQEIMGSNGTYRQVNILHGRSYNVPQWRQLCEQSEHQPPAKRGERRANADRPKPPRRPAAPKTTDASAPKKRGKGRATRTRGKLDKTAERPMTPVSPKPDALEQPEATAKHDEVVDSIEKELGEEIDSTEEPAAPGRMGGSRQPKAKTQSTSARRKFSRREGSAMIDEESFKDFDYRMDISDYTPERCEELERAYWKTLTYAQPLYGADMMGTLFDERTETWNLGKLPNILDVLGSKIPGVNTAYLYFGMWKATFAWHLEDVDLYSINYVHFGAPKQWYSISQADARRFEAAMKNTWPADAKACDQFLRHKGFLISPHHLLQHFNIRVNKVVSYPGEFVVTYPYGYHSGYNLGYNCAEAVNFALESWLEMGKLAKKCECAQAQDSVWINVHEIERKLRGEETEYEETEDEDEEDEDDDELSGLLSPPASHGIKFKIVNRKRKRDAGEKGGKIKIKRIKLRLKSREEPPCCLCPNDISTMELLPTDDGRKAHRICALYLPETYIDMVDEKEVVSNIGAIHKDRADLKCLFCRSKRGACFQCSQKKCARAYHATCAAAAGVFVEEQDVPVFGDDKTEYKEQAFEFSCRFHRTKREKKIDGAALEEDERIREAAKSLQTGDIGQFQYHKGEIFAGVVVENRTEEEMVLIDVLPNGHRLEVEWKWLLLPDPSDYHLPKASATALPLPASRKAKDQLNAKRQGDEKPRKEDPFVEGCTWAEFNLHEVERNSNQAKIDLQKDDQIWYYLGQTSTEAKAQYTESLAKPRHNPKGNYLDSLPKPPKPAPAPSKQPTYSGRTTQYNNTSYGMNPFAKPYVYKPNVPVTMTPDTTVRFTSQTFAPNLTVPANYQNQQQGSTPVSSGTYSTQRFQIKPSHYNQLSWQNQGPANVVKTVQTSSNPIPAQARQFPKPSWQVHSSIYQKYPFFQVHHNRDSSKYRTPYSTWGGFTNGYEGSLKAHILSNHQDVLRRASMSSILSQNTPNKASGGAGGYKSVYGDSLPAVSSPAWPQTPTHQQSIPPRAAPGSKTQQSLTQSQISAQVSKPRPIAAPKPYKIPVKQSPVPLPANFLAAMNSTPPASRANSTSQAPKSSPSLSPKSTAPVPIPRFPGMTPHQAAAQAASPPVPPHKEQGPSHDIHPRVALADATNTAQQHVVDQTTRVPGSIQFSGTDSASSEWTQSAHQPVAQEFPDVPGSESMEFMEKMMANLRRVSQSGLSP